MIFYLVICGYRLKTVSESWVGLLVLSSDVVDEKAGDFTVKEEPNLES